MCPGTRDLRRRRSLDLCHIPKGGLARIASFTDSIRTQFGQVLLVTTGGFFPEQSGDEENAAFMLDAMKLVGFDAAGVSEKELHYGVSFLLANSRRSHAPLTCANLFTRVGHKPLVAPYLVQKVGTVTVGLFGLTSDKADLGAAADSVVVEDPVAACAILPPCPLPSRSSRTTAWSNASVRAAWARCGSRRTRSCRGAWS